MIRNLRKLRQIFLAAIFMILASGFIFAGNNLKLIGMDDKAVKKISLGREFSLSKGERAVFKNLAVFYKDAVEISPMRRLPDGTENYPVVEYHFLASDGKNSKELILGGQVEDRFENYQIKLVSVLGEEVTLVVEELP